MALNVNYSMFSFANTDYCLPTVKDLKFACRQLLKNPGFIALAVPHSGTRHWRE